MTSLNFEDHYPKFPEGEEPPCAETDPEMFFPQDVSETYSPITGRWTVNSRYYNVEGAKSVCGGCPQIKACLEYALSDIYIQGIWGGTTEHQRRDMRLAMLEQDKISKP